MRCRPIKRPLITIILMCIVLFQSGCEAESGSIYANYRDVAQLQLIQTVGIDIDEENNSFQRMTISSGKAAGNGTRLLMSRSAPSLSTAMESLQDYASSQTLFYDHARYVLIGKDAAEQGIGSYLSFIQRSTDLSKGVSLFVIKNSSAHELMKSCKEESYDITEVMSSIMRDLELRGDSHAFTCGDTAKALANTGSALICALSSADAGETVYSAEVPVTAVPDGFGILVGDKVADYISIEDSPAACMLLGFGGIDELVFTDDEGNRLTVAIYRYKTDVSPVYDSGGRLSKVKVDVKLDAGLMEAEEDHNVLSGEFLSRSGSALSKKIKQRLENVLDKEKSLSADFLALGHRLRSKDAGAFENMPVKWPSALEGLEFEVNVDAAIGRSYDLDGSVNYNGGERHG